MSDYIPISCGSYDRYELAIMHRERLHLVWHEGKVYFDRVLTPINLETRAGAEYLLARTDDGDLHTIRLDHIRRVEAP